MKKNRITIITLTIAFLLSGCGNVSININSTTPAADDDKTSVIDPLYAFKLDEYISALEDHIDYETAGVKELSMGVTLEGETAETMSFALLDLNDDGNDELLILPSLNTENPNYYDENYLYALYTTKKNEGYNELKTVTTISFGPRDEGYYLYDDGIIKFKLGGTGIDKSIYYRLDEAGEFEFVDEIVRFAQPDENNNFVEGWYRCTDGTVDIMYLPSDDEYYGTHYFEEITEAEANSIKQKYEKSSRAIERTRLAEYKAAAEKER